MVNDFILSLVLGYFDSRLYPHTLVLISRKIVEKIDRLSIVLPNNKTISNSMFVWNLDYSKIKQVQY